MPLLTKSSKGHLSQQKSGFKIPYADHKHKIKDIIDNKLNEPETKKAYHAFVDGLSQEKYENRLSSPKQIHKQRSGNKENPPEKTNRTVKKGKKNEYESKRENKKRRFSFDTEGSISQDELNKGEIKSAYVEFMNNSLADGGIKKKKGLIIYSSSEDLFEDVVERFRNGSEEILTEKNSQKETKKKLHAKKKSRDRKPSHEQIEKSMSDNEFVGQFRKDSVKEKATEKKNKKKTDKKSHKKKVPRHRKLSDEQIEPCTNDSEFPDLTEEEKMNEIYEKRNVGLYVLCDKCDKARYLPHVVDPLELPATWFCHMNPDKKHNKCSDPEHVEEDRDFLIDNLYNAGSIVFVKMDGYPWWPAMVEDDVDTETYFWLEGNSMSPTYYHVTFFDSAEVTRAWMRPDRIQPFIKNVKNPAFQVPAKYRYKSRVNAAIKQALDAADMPLVDRLKTYGFIKRYKKPAKRSKNTENGEKSNKRHRELSPSIDGMSLILENINMSDLSFNLLD